jgi:hypothetical protein
MAKISAYLASGRGAVECWQPVEWKVVHDQSVHRKESVWLGEIVQQCTSQNILRMQSKRKK